MDEDADDLSFPAMVSQLLEFVLCIVSNETFLGLLQPVLPELAYLTIGALPYVRPLSTLGSNLIVCVPAHCWMMPSTALPLPQRDVWALIADLSRPGYYM